MALNIQRLNFDPVTGDNPSEAFMKLDIDIGVLTEAIDGDGSEENPGLEARVALVEGVAEGLGDAATKNVGTEAGTVAAGDDPRIKETGTVAGTVAAGDDTRFGTLDTRVTSAAAAAAGAQATADAALPKAGGALTGPVTISSASTNLLEMSGSGQYTGQFYTNGGVRWLVGAARVTSPPAGVPAGALFLYEWPNSAMRFAIAPNGGAITMVGNVNVSATLTAVAVTQTSSFDVKENIHAFDGALDIVDRISVVTFTYDQAFLEGDQKTRLGVLAENIEVSMPSAYSPGQSIDNEDGDATVIPASVDYAQFGPLTIRALQELRAQVSALQVRVAQLESAAGAA